MIKLIHTPDTSLRKVIPHWSNHARVTETVDTREEDEGQKKRKIHQFFQVGVMIF